MKQFTALVLTLCMLLVPCLGLAESAYTGYVTAGSVEIISAPYGGRISKLLAQEGTLIQEDSLLAELDTEKTYSPADGLITAVFAETGNTGETIQSQYGAILWIEPLHHYTVKCSVSNKQKSVDNQWISIGEKVFLRNTSNRQREGTGFVTALSSKEGEEDVFYVEVDSGEFILGESVSVNRDTGFSQDGSIGSGRVQRNAPIAVNAEGSIAAIHVKVGDHINVGDLLFETIKSSLPQTNLSEIKNTSTGIVAEVSKQVGDMVDQGETIATVYPLDHLQIEIQLPESCLNDVHVGDPASISFNWMSDSDKQYPATVNSISYLGTSSLDSGNTTYAVVLDFDADSTVRIGMTVTVYFGMDAQITVEGDTSTDQQE